MTIRLWDCDTSRLHLRGTNVAIITGDASASAEDLESLRAQFRAAYGPGPFVIYLSREGFQALPDAPSPEAEALADAPQMHPVDGAMPRPADDSRPRGRKER